MAKCLKEKSCANMSREILKKMNSSKIIDDFQESILADIKELGSYKRLKELCTRQFCEPLHYEDLRKKKQMEIAETGILAIAIDSSISELTTKKMQNCAKDVILNMLKDLKNADLTADTSECNSKPNENLMSKNGKSESDIKTSIATENTDTVANTFESHSRCNGSLTSENMAAKSNLRISVKNKNIDTASKTSVSSSKSYGSQIPDNQSIESNRKISGKYKKTDTTASGSKSSSMSNRNLISKNRNKKSHRRSANRKNADSNSQNSNNFDTANAKYFRSQLL